MRFCIRCLHGYLIAFASRVTNHQGFVVNLCKQICSYLDERWLRKNARFVLSADLNPSLQLAVCRNISGGPGLMLSPPCKQGVGTSFRYIFTGKTGILRNHVPFTLSKNNVIRAPLIAWIRPHDGSFSISFCTKSKVLWKQSMQADDVLTVPLASWWWDSISMAAQPTPSTRTITESVQLVLFVSLLSLSLSLILLVCDSFFTRASICKSIVVRWIAQDRPEPSLRMGSPAVLEAQIRELQVFVVNIYLKLFREVWWKHENRVRTWIQTFDSDVRSRSMWLSSKGSLPITSQLFVIFMLFIHSKGQTYSSLFRTVWIISWKWVAWRTNWYGAFWICVIELFYTMQSWWFPSSCRKNR